MSGDELPTRPSRSTRHTKPHIQFSFRKLRSYAYLRISLHFIQIQAYWTMKEKIVEFEQVLLRTINFQVDPPDPYRLLLNYARSLRLDRAATRTAWGLVNDVLLCPRALSAPPPAVACAAIRMATRIHGSDRRLRWFSPPCRNFSNSNKNKRPRGLDLEEGDDVGISSGGGVSAAGVLGPGSDGSGGGSRDNVDGSSASGGAGSAGGDGAGGGRVNESAAGGEKNLIPSPTATDELNVMVPPRRESAAAAADGGGNGRRSPGASAHEADSNSGGGSELIREAVGAAFGTGAAGTVVDPNVAAGGESSGEGWRDSGDVRAGTENATSAMPWWGLFDARDEEVELVCAELLALYRAQGGNMSNNGDDARADPGVVIERDPPKAGAKAASVVSVSTDEAKR